MKEQERHLCTTCQERKPASAFAPSVLRRRSKVCRDCKAEYNRRWYDDNKEKHKTDVVRNTARYREEIGALYLRLKSGPCADCGLTFHPAAMDFDHVRGTKVIEVAQAYRRMFSLERLMAEIAKCDLVCAICHRVRTDQRSGAERTGEAHA